MSNIIKYGVIVGSMVEEREQRRGAERDQKRAREAEQRIQDIKTARERRKAVREARIAKAEVVSGSVAKGTSTTSSATSGAGAVGTQLAANLSFLDNVRAETKNVSLFEEKAIKHVNKANDIAAIRGFVTDMGSLFAGGG